jgi:hypothetical protein
MAISCRPTSKIAGQKLGYYSPQRVPVFVAPPDPAVGKTHTDPCIRVHDVAPIHDRRLLTPAQPPDLSRHQPPVLLVPGKDHHRIRAGKHPARSREIPGGASGDVAGSTQGSCTATSAPAAIAASRNGSAGVFRASSESLMNAQPRSAIFEPAKGLPDLRERRLRRDGACARA